MLARWLALLGSALAASPPMPPAVATAVTTTAERPIMSFVVIFRWRRSQPVTRNLHPQVAYWKAPVLLLIILMVVASAVLVAS